MKKASLISIGEELLSGATVDTNAGYFCKKLLQAGVPVESVYTVGDDKGRIVRAMELAFADADIVLVTGGLGPTDDDVTREAVAEFLGVELVFSDELLAEIEQYFRGRGLTMAQSNKRQAFLPAGAEPLRNTLGTAPGILVRQGGKLLAVMPGVPSEMKAMFEGRVLEVIRKEAACQAVCVRKLRCFGTGESNIADMLGDMMRRGRNPLVNSTAGGGVITVHIVARAETAEKAREMAQADENSIAEILGEVVFGVAGDTLEEVVGRQLGRDGLTVATAESCTGGLIAKMLTDVPGASGWLRCGWVTYSNEAKIRDLGVDTELIKMHGAVSEQVAVAMAAGARLRAGVDIAVAVTGIAGPGGGSEEKPVGLVYIGLCDSGGCEVRRFQFARGRGVIRQRAAQAAINMVRLRIANLTK